MTVVTVQEDGRIQLPETVRQRLGLGPGTRLVVEEGTGHRELHLRVLPGEPQLVEKDGVWVLRFGDGSSPEAGERDPVAELRQERLDSFTDSQ